MPIPTAARPADYYAAYAALTTIYSRPIRRGGLHLNNFVSDTPKIYF